MPDFHELIRLCAQGCAVQTMIALYTAFIHHKTNAHCFALISAQFEQLKNFLTRLLIQIHWVFKARFRSIHTLHGCTVFPAMVLWEYIIGVGVVMLLRFDSTMPLGSNGHAVCNSSVNRHKRSHPSHCRFTLVKSP